MSEARSFEVLEGHRYVRLTTFRKNGEAVSTPVWFALVGGRAHVFTDLHSGKARRIRNIPSWRRKGFKEMPCDEALISRTARYRASRARVP